MVLSPGLEQQWNDYNAELSAFVSPSSAAREPPFANTRVDNRFEPFSVRFIGKNQIGQMFPPQAPGTVNNLWAKERSDFFKGRFARLDYLAREHIRVDDRHAPLGKKLP